MLTLTQEKEYHSLNKKITEAMLSVESKLPKKQNSH